MRLAVLLVLLALLPACALFRPRFAELEVGVVNEGNRLLAVEGTSNLPEGIPIEAELREGEGRLLSRGRADLRDSRFCLTLDLGRAPGNVPLDLLVFVDPVSAPEPVLAEVGDDGSRLVGDQVEWEHGRHRVVERLRVVLPMGPCEAALRKIARGDFAGGIAVLEQVVAREPADAEAAAWLALARLERSPADRRPGSEAHLLLQRALAQGPPEPALSQGQRWLARLEAEEARRRLQAARQQALRQARQQRERRAHEIRPGQSLGIVELGMEVGSLFAHMTPERYPTPGQVGLQRVAFPKEGLVVEFDGVTGKVVRAVTTSDRFRLPGDLGVGTPFLAFREKHPEAPLTFGPYERGPEGERIARGTCVLEGLEVIVRRTADPGGPPFDEVESLAVVALQAVVPPRANAPESAPAPPARAAGPE